MKIEMVPVDKLIPYEKNPRLHSQKGIEVIQKIIKKFGITQPIVADKDLKICIGHARLQAIKKLKIKEAPVFILDIPEKQFEALLIADNKSQQYSTWDFNLLNTIIEDIPEDLKSLAGFDDNEFLIDDIDADIEDEDVENADTPPQNKDRPQNVNEHIILLYSADAAADIKEKCAILQKRLELESTESLIYFLINNAMVKYDCSSK